jgi:hypothetical protein
MSAIAHVTMPRFSGDKLDYSQYRRDLLNRASTSSTTCSEGFGLLGFLLPTEEWIAVLTRADHPDPVKFVPLVHPGDRPQAGAQFPAWKADFDNYVEQRRDINKFKMTFRASLDEVSHAAMDVDDDGVSSLSLSRMLDILDRMYRILSPSDLSRNADKLLVIFQPPTTIRAFITAQRRAHIVAAANSFPFPETEKIRAFVGALTPCGVFNGRIEAWKMAVPSAAAQTFDLLAEAILEYADNQDIQVTSGAFNYASQVIVPSVASPSPMFSADQLASIAQLVAAAVHAMPTKNTRSQGAAKHYCWTHGFSSNLCKKPAEGHIESATAKNQQGGSNKRYVN